MPVSITTKHKFFDNQNNALILFKDTFDDSYSTLIQDDFILIFSQNKMVGINILNYQKYFDLKEGYHVLSNDVKDWLLKKFNQYLSEEDFDCFYQIGKVVDIQQHNQSDKLKILTVLFNNDIKRQIITNVSSINLNQNYLFATNGTTTFNGQKILDTQVMKVKSEGMIVSYKTIGIEKEGLVDCSNLSLQDTYFF